MNKFTLSMFVLAFGQTASCVLEFPMEFCNAVMNAILAIPHRHDEDDSSEIVVHGSMRRETKTVSLSYDRYADLILAVLPFIKNELSHANGESASARMRSFYHSSQYSFMDFMMRAVTDAVIGSDEAPDFFECTPTMDAVNEIGDRLAAATEHAQACWQACEALVIKQSREDAIAAKMN